MNKKLNWKKMSNLIIAEMTQRLFTISLTLLISLTSLNAQVNNLKIKNKDVNGEPKPYMKIGGAAEFPCGENFSISLEDETRFIFSAASAFNATVLPNGDLDEPNDGVGVNGKTANDEPMSYQHSFERIRNLKLGYHNSAMGEKWAIADKQMQELYPNQSYEVKYNNETRTAFHYNNVFFEMLMSIQLLANKNEEQQTIIEAQTAAIERLNERLEQLENTLNNNNQANLNKTLGEVTINPNPITNGTLQLAYQLNDYMPNAVLKITDIQGKQVYEKTLNISNTKGNQHLNIDLPAGTYFYYLVNNADQTPSKKLIIL